MPNSSKLHGNLNTTELPKKSDQVALSSLSSLLGSFTLLKVSDYGPLAWVSLHYAAVVFPKAGDIFFHNLKENM